MSRVKCYWMLKNSSVTAFTVSELLIENQPEIQIRINCTISLESFIILMTIRNKKQPLTTNICTRFCQVKHPCSNPLYKKWSIPLLISSANVTKSARNCGFCHITWIILNEKLHFSVQRTPFAFVWNVFITNINASIL